MSDTIVTIVGNLADDPRQHPTGNGSAVTSFRVGCVQRRFDKAQNRWVDGATSWYRVSAFRMLGQHSYESLRKGQRVIVSGRLKLRTWEAGDKHGVAAEIDADAVGHDLLWGTSTFASTSTRRGDDASTSAAAEGEGGAATWSTSEAGWAVPGGQDTSAERGAHEGSEPAVPSWVGADAALVGGTTPF